MAVAIRGAQGSNNGTGGSSITVNMPSGVKDGDYLLMCVCANLGGVTGPAGWTEIFLVSQSKTVFWRMASNEPASYTATFPTAKAAAVVIALSGANPVFPDYLTSPFYKISENASSSTVSAPALGTFSIRNGIDVFFGATNVGTTTGQPTNYTEPSGGSATNSGGGSASSKATVGVATRTLFGVTTVGSLTATYGAAATNTGFHIFVSEGPPIGAAIYSTAVHRASRW
jgi:hypothetical protein